MFWIINAISVCLLAILLAGIMIPQILLISFRKKLFDEPDARKIHKLPVPRLGGIAFVPVILFSISFSLGVTMLLGYHSMLDALLGDALPATFCFCSALVLYILGMADDLIGVKYRAKFAAQIICAIMLIMGGLVIDDFHGVLWLHDIWPPVAWLFTTLTAIFIINAINLIDGIDGLASGLSSVAVAVYAGIFFLTERYLFLIIAMATLGVLIPFFYYNVFGNPEKRKKIFMGDTGSLSIGLILCILTFGMINTKPTEQIHDINPVIVAISPLIIPCFDVLRVYFYRIRHGRNPFLPDKNHIHHRLLELGLPQRVAMISILAVSVIFTTVNTILSKYLNVNLILLLDVVVWTGSMMVLSRFVGRARARRAQAAQQQQQQ